ncbi:MAG: histidine kinase [Bacteroidia bacterium]|jgi:hypothetical protein|nr:histidine kinase [Bacteroidia bacterium]
MFKEFSTRYVAFAFGTWWVLWTAVVWYIITFYGVSWQQALVDASINMALLALTSIAVLNTIKFYRPTRGNLLYLRLWSLLHALFISAVHGWLIAEIYSYQIEVVRFVELSSPIRYVFNLVMIGISTTAIVIYHYVKDEREHELRKDAAEQLAKETELIKLRQQLQPHFLFNSLNSISALAGSKPEQARKMIQQLSDFLRGTLRKEEQQLTTLRDELHHLQLYLDIEKVRFGHRLETAIQCGAELEALELPPLILQPIVENAIKFGLYDTTDAVLIELTAQLAQKELIVQVKNPFDAVTAAPRKGTGFGLNAVSRRLYLLYGRTDLLKTHTEGNLFITTIHIPQP